MAHLGGFLCGLALEDLLVPRIGAAAASVRIWFLGRLWQHVVAAAALCLLVLLRPGADKHEALAQTTVLGLRGDTYTCELSNTSVSSKLKLSLQLQLNKGLFDLLTLTQDGRPGYIQNHP